MPGSIEHKEASTHYIDPELQDLHKATFEERPLGDNLGGATEENLGIMFRPVAPELTDEEFLIDKRCQMTSIDIVKCLATIKQETDFKPNHGRWEFVRDFGKFAITKAGIHIPYADTLRKAEQKSGKSEAAMYGFATFEEEDCVLFTMEWDFIGGSVGAVVGEKLLAAMKLAEEKKVGVVMADSSGGMRQQENLFALWQMIRGVSGVNRYCEKTDTPQIAILLGQVWGGTSASTVPLADVIIGVAGSNFGFAGPGVIGAFEGVQPPAGSQSVEANYMNRNVDVIVEQSELRGYIAHYLATAKSAEKIKKDEVVPLTIQQKIWDLEHMRDKARQLVMGPDGFAPALFENQRKDELSCRTYDIPPIMQIDPTSTDPNDLFENYLRIITEVGRPDGEFFIRNVFDSAVPLYNHYVRSDKITYPPIISAVARLNNQPFLVIANQPSYSVRSDGSIRKHLATPRPEDYERVEELMEMAQRRGLPVVTLTDTLGAAPTIQSERRGQSRRIARSIKALETHKKPVISVVIGGLGSGGGIATTAGAPVLLALDYAQMWVAEPKSATSILQGTDRPTEEQVKELMSGFECSAHEIKELGLPVHIIKTTTDAFEIARSLRHSILEVYNDQSKLSEKKLLERRRRVIDKIGKNVIKQGAKKN